MKVFTFWSASKNEVIIIVEESLTEAIKVMNSRYITPGEKDDYIIGSSIPAIKGYNCSTTILTDITI